MAEKVAGKVPEVSVETAERNGAKPRRKFVLILVSEIFDFFKVSLEDPLFYSGSKIVQKGILFYLLS